MMKKTQQRHIEPNTITFSAAISACEKDGQWERALELLTEMKTCGQEPNVITLTEASKSTRADGLSSPGYRLSEGTKLL